MHIPLATYRLQFSPQFSFGDAASIVSYLHALGISDCYASPYFQAVPGSSHGYDIINPQALNPELGTVEDYDAFVQELHRHNMGQLLDIVPNHMGIAKGLNPWWADVLANGQRSAYAPFFDIDWTPVTPGLTGKVLLPILGDRYGRVLENQEIQVCYENNRLCLRYYEHCFPLSPHSWTLILSYRLDDLERALGPTHPAYREFCAILIALKEHDPAQAAEYSQTQQRLRAVVAESAEVRAFIKENVRMYNGIRGEPKSFALLDMLLNEQVYRLAYWRTAAEEINYRRFFDINELAAVCVEDPAVFSATHQFVFQLLAEGKVTGLRIDHIDGLYDPAGYLQRLQRSATSAHNESLYIVVEKILEADEGLPQEWPVQGTTGYDFLCVLNGLFIDQDNEAALTDVYTQFVGRREHFADCVYAAKKLIIRTLMASELKSLTSHLKTLAAQTRQGRDFTQSELTQALTEIMACFPVYRTYIDEQGVSAGDNTYIQTALSSARLRNPATNRLVFDYIGQVLSLRIDASVSEQLGQAYRSFVMKFQQYTGPTMAKGLEDTALYRYNRLVSLNEVGGTPDQFGLSVTAFHTHNHEQLERWPHSLLTTSTHDTKRSEDVRARINVLSEIPYEWGEAVQRWSELNAKKKQIIEGRPVPDRNEEYVLYQTLLGAWPLTQMTANESTLFTQRIQSYMQKATKEAKVHTSWIDPNLAYDKTLQDFIHTVLGDAAFIEAFQPLASKVAHYGMYNALAQTLLKLTVPGVPDIYQGNELWDFSLVDPDNRRPVDYAHRRRLLSALQQPLSAAEQNTVPLVQELLTNWQDGRIKLYITARVLTYRRQHPELFLRGSYKRVEIAGRQHQHLCAFARQRHERAIIVIVPRLFTKLSPSPALPPIGLQVWDDTWLLPPTSADHHYHNIFTGKSIGAVERQGHWMLSLAEVFAHFPFAILEQKN